MSDHNDGTGYWYRLWTIGTPEQHGFDVMGDDDLIITECLHTYPTRDEAIAAAIYVINVYRNS